jgi:hypothetical protein
MSCRCRFDQGKKNVRVQWVGCDTDCSCTRGAVNSVQPQREFDQAPRLFVFTVTRPLSPVVEAQVLCSAYCRVVRSPQVDVKESPGSQGGVGLVERVDLRSAAGRSVQGAPNVPGLPNVVPVGNPLRMAIF